MNKDTIKGDWKQLSGKIKAKWGELTDDDLKQSEGNSEYLLGKLQEKYGLAKDKAKQHLKDFGL
ncbi:CsbD family protein [Perlucidibaca aquatica]|uniref:CsbD family protein n=1 Tax=Perlucidibaca aquatica TaxID=1852776 RepID=UPI00083A58A6|nr:CsbD family protein [Perlucidibaca aquatica]